MKLQEISKDEFHQKLIDPRPVEVRALIKEFEKTVNDYGFDVIVNERPFYEGVWSMKAIARKPEPQKAVPHPQLQKVRTAYYFVFTNYEREKDITIMHGDDTVNSLSWYIHFN